MSSYAAVDASRSTATLSAISRSKKLFWRTRLRQTLTMTLETLDIVIRSRRSSSRDNDSVTCTLRTAQIPLGSSRLDTTRHGTSRRACRAVLFDKLDTARMHGLDTSNVSCRVQTWRDEPSGIWAYMRLPFTAVRTLVYSIIPHHPILSMGWCGGDCRGLACTS